MAEKPRISVVIPTCDRPRDIDRCLASLAGVKYARWNLIIVDQGSASETSEILAAYSRQLPDLLHIGLPMKNASLARNKGLEVATGDIVAFLDDDCTVEPGWLEQVVAVFARHPGAAMVFGTVRAIEHDHRECFIPSYEARFEGPITTRWALGGVMGASMYLRRPLAGRGALFDVHFGPGAQPFSSGQDWDLAYRLLRCGANLVRTPAVVVLHYGARNYRDGSATRLGRSCAFSVGGLTMKMIRAGDPAALLLLGAQALKYLAHIQLKNLIRLRRPTGLAWSGWFLSGLIASFHLEIDRHHCLYRVRAGKHPILTNTPS